MADVNKEEKEESLEQIKRTIGGKDSFRPEDVPPAVLKRLPRYFRYLRELIRMGKSRVSSYELANMMNVTASQIRQDLNWFGGFGQQGYGYNVNYLYTKICELLGVGCGFRAAVFGAGHLGSALVSSPMFEKRGIDVVALFDVDEKLIGKKIKDAEIYHMDELEAKVEEFQIDVAILTLPKEFAVQTAQRLENAGIYGIWNFTGKELELDRNDIVVENVHLGDSLMILCYEVARKENERISKLANKKEDGIQG